MEYILLARKMFDFSYQNIQECDGILYRCAWNQQFGNDNILLSAARNFWKLPVNSLTVLISSNMAYRRRNFVALLNALTQKQEEPRMGGEKYSK